MKKIPFNKLFKRSIRTVAVLIFLACASGPADLNEFTSYFLPESAPVQEGDGRYHYTQQFLYLDEYSDSLRLDENTNAQALGQICGCQMKVLRTITFIQKSANNTLPNRLMLKGNKAAVAYIQLAKNIEKAYQPAIHAWEESSKDSLALVEAFQ